MENLEMKMNEINPYKSPREIMDSCVVDTNHVLNVTGLLTGSIGAAGLALVVYNKDAYNYSFCTATFVGSSIFGLSRINSFYRSFFNQLNHGK